MNKLMIVCVLVILLAASTIGAGEIETPAGVAGLDELVKEKGKFEDTRVRPDADLARYDALVFQVGEIGFREVAANPADAAGRIDPMTSEFGLTEDEQEKTRRVFSQAVVDELGRSKKLRLVDEVGPDTLVVRASVLDFVCRVPPLNNAQVASYPSVVGEGTLRFELIDPETGEIQVWLEDRSRILPSGRYRYEVSARPVNRLTMWKDIDQWFRDDGVRLRRVLEKKQK